MKNFFEIENAEQLKAIADPLRRRLLEVFAGEPITTKQAASVIDEKPTKLYHHVDFLERNGLIKLVETKQNRGTIEKYYQSVAAKFVVCRDLTEVSSKQEGEANDINNMLVESLESSLSNLRESLNGNLLSKKKSSNAIALVSSQVFLDENQINDLADVLQNWLKKNDTSKSKDKTLHQLTLVCFPVRK